MHANKLKTKISRLVTKNVPQKKMNHYKIKQMKSKQRKRIIKSWENVYFLEATVYNDNKVLAKEVRSTGTRYMDPSNMYNSIQNGCSHRHQQQSYTKRYCWWTDAADKLWRCSDGQESNTRSQRVSNGNSGVDGDDFAEAREWAKNGLGEW